MRRADEPDWPPAEHWPGSHLDARLGRDLLGLRRQLREDVARGELLFPGAAWSSQRIRDFWPGQTGGTDELCATVQACRLPRVYFPTAPALGAVVASHGGVGFVQVTPASRGLEIVLERLRPSDEDSARALIETLAMRWALTPCRVRVVCPPGGTGGQSWGLAVAVALQAHRHGLPCPIDAFSGVVSLGAELAVAPVEHGPVKHLVIARELPRVALRSVGGRRPQPLETLLQGLLDPPPWAAVTRPVGRRYRELVDRDRRNVFSGFEPGSKDHGDEFLDEHLWLKGLGRQTQFTVENLKEELEPGRAVFLHGPAGLGKSSRARRVASDWAANRGPVVFLGAEPAAPASLGHWIQAQWEGSTAPGTVSWEDLARGLSRVWRGRGTGSHLLMVVTGFERCQRPEKLMQLLLVGLESPETVSVLVTSRAAPSPKWKTRELRFVCDSTPDVPSSFEQGARAGLIERFVDENGEPVLQTPPVCISMERQLHVWEREDDLVARTMHRLARHAVARTPVLWERLVPERAPSPCGRHQCRTALRSWHERGVVNSQGDWEPYWDEAFRLWWLREEAQAHASRERKLPRADEDPLGWTHSPPPHSVARAIPTWPRPHHGEDLLKAVKHIVGEDLVAGFRWGTNMPGDSVIKDGVGMHRLRLGLRSSGLAIEVRRDPGAWLDAGICHSVVDVLEVFRLLSEDWWWQDLHTPESGAAIALGWILGVLSGQEGLDRLLEMASDGAPGLRDGLSGFRIRQSELPPTTACLVTPKYWAEWRLVLLEAPEDWRAVWAGFSFSDIELTLQAMLDRHADLAHDVREGNVEASSEELYEVREGDRALFQGLGELVGLVGSDLPDWRLEEVYRAVEDTVLRLTLGSSPVPGHHAHLLELVSLAMATGGLKSSRVGSDPDHSWPGLEEQRQWLTHCVRLMSVADVEWFTGAGGDRGYLPDSDDPESSRDGDRICVDQSNVEQVLQLLFSDLRDSSELALVDLLCGVFGPAVALSTESERPETEAHVRRYGRPWITAEILEMLGQESLTELLYRVDFRSLMKLAGCPDVQPWPALEQVEEATAVILERLR